MSTAQKTIHVLRLITKLETKQLVCAQQFGPFIIGLLKSIRMREEGRQRQQQQQMGVSSLAAGLGGGVGGQQQQQNTGYSRYAQEKFNPKEGKL